MARLTIEEVDRRRGGARRCLALLCDGEPWLEVTEAMLAELGLRDGDELDAARRAAIEAELGAAARTLVLRSLATRGRSLAEARTTLAARDVPASVAEAAIEAVAGYGYLDDAKLAEQIAEALLERGYGPRRAKQELARRGIAPDDAATALEHAFGERDEVALARAAIARRDIGAGERAAARAAAFLQRRGFSSEAAWQAVQDELRAREDA